MKTFIASVLMSLMATVASAEWRFDFRQPNYDPQNAQSIVVVQPVLPRITIKAIAPNSSLYWDATDGFGINGPSYSDDEVEGPREVLAVIFDKPVRVMSIRVSDFFYESEAYFGAPPCYIPGWYTCYQELGQYSYDGGVTWHEIAAPLGNLREVTNGEYEFPTFVWTAMLLFRAPGPVNVQGFPYTQLHEFSLQSITLKETY